LISENNTEFSYRYSYTYDGNNNIASVTSIGTPTSNTPPFPPITSRPVATTYVYEGDKLVGIRGLGFLGNVIPYESDANGNLTDYGVYELTWTQGNKLEAVTNSNGTYRYSYDENGLRYKKESTVNSVTTETRYFLDGTTIIAEETGGALTQYYYDSTGVIGMRYNNENYYFVKDLFGNVHKVLHQDGTKVAQYEYDAWGNCETITNVNGMADINPFRYRGYYMDVETGYYYLQSRYYDPVLRRFISSDNYGLISTLAESGDINMFAYCGNNPVMYTDSTGQWIETVFDLFSLGASVVEIVINPANPWAWAGLIGDAVDLLPFVTGVGEGIRATKMVKYADDVIDASYDTIKFVKATDMVDDFSDGGKMLDDFAHLDDYYKSTVSNLRDGRTIHMMFMDNGMRIPNSKLRVDGLNEITNTIFELKPYNIQNARKGVKQILIYNDALGGGYKMIIVLY
ncbi:MAG: hypothetical protein IKC48_01890, partial [Clostridia bacterium]|nr:hypothetical protein [Clostridia bacterium]